MSDQLLDLSVTIGGLSGSPASINLHDRIRYELAEPLLDSGISHRVTEITGENQPGSVVVNWVRDTATLSGVVRVLGTSEATLRANIRLLFRSLSRYPYSITEVIDGNSHTFTRCQPANISTLGGQDWDVQRAYHTQKYTIQIRCHPRTVETP